jgi:rifampicin phosphotransferase
MSPSSDLIVPLSKCRETSLVGGKAANLGRLIRAGFPVPDGFVVTTRAYCMAHTARALKDDHDWPAGLFQSIRQAYAAMGGGTVAVRSSATAEDAAAASMAGQYETILDVRGEQQVIDAVWQCWRSLDAPRAKAYLRRHEIDSADVGMAVVVQRLVSADVAGVLFTSNPHNGWHREMLLEASWGLGELLVSGQVQPDALRLERETGRVLSTTIADKHVRLVAGTREEQVVEESQRRQPCLRSRDVHRLWQLGKRAAEHFGSPQDIEWAIQNEEVYLLQSRPITTFQEAETYETVLHGARQHLREEIAAGRGPWVVHNLAETLPHPTPLSWSVVSRFMSGSGGFGAMYRQAGFDPSPEVSRNGFLELILGCVYMDVSRAPEMFFENFPYAYALEELLHSADASQSPPTLPNGNLIARTKAERRLAKVNARLHGIAADYDRRMVNDLFPSISKYVAEERQCDLASLSVDQFTALWRKHETQVLDVFGSQLLMPSLISAMAIADLRNFLAENFWNEDPDSLAHLISSGGAPNRTVIADAELYEVARGKRSLENWLADHGHRATNEFDLSAPRWREQPLTVRDLAARLAGGDPPLERHRRHSDVVGRRIEELRRNLGRHDRRELDSRLALVRRYIGFREDSKDFLMLAYDLLRDLALEAGRRTELGADVFCLTREELFDALRVGFAPYHLVEQRKTAYRTESRFTLPRVITEADIETLGSLPEREPGAGARQGLAVSAGAASGPARILSSPAQAGDLGQDYILVCPGTDPSWTPLFAGAAGLLLERGGMLSHGAVVAREMGLPAVVLPDATRLFCEGERIWIDGSRGRAGRESDASQPTATEKDDPDSLCIAAELAPPPPGRKDRAAARWRNICSAIWTVYLLSVFLLPERWVYQPSLSAMDYFLWPVVHAWGKPATVALLAAGMALFTLVIQRLITDNRCLREAKRRAAALNKMANSLPANSPRRAQLQRLTTAMPLRSLSSAMVPVGILLGPMVMPFIWLKERVDPSACNPPPGSAVTVVATVDSDFAEPVHIAVPQELLLDAATPSAQSLPPIRKTLEQLLALYRQPRTDPSLPWELAVVPDIARQQTADSLQAYLAAGIPPQKIAWTLHPSEDAGGRSAVVVSAGDSAPLVAFVVLGDDYPPAPRCTRGPNHSPVKEIRIVYPKSTAEPVFWRPVERLSELSQTPIAGRLAAMNVTWLWLYILVYLPALMLFRIALRVA